MKPSNRHDGDRSEYLALFAFSTIGFCAEVPRQDDRFGVDFFVHLARKQGQNLVATGRAIAVQVKSAGTTMEINSVELRDCLYGPSLPYFLVEIDKATSRIRVFSLYNRIYQFWVNRDANVRIRLEPWPAPGGAPAGVDPFDLFVGPPVFEASLSELDDGPGKVQKRAEFLAVIESWAKWEQLHLAWKEDQFPLIGLMKQYETNVPLPLGKLPPEKVDHLVVTNPLYLEGAVRSASKTVYGIGEFFHRYIGDMEHFEAIAQHDEGFPAWADDVRKKAGELLGLLQKFKVEGAADGTG